MSLTTRFTRILYGVACLSALFALGMIAISTPHWISTYRAEDWHKTTGTIVNEEYGVSRGGRANRVSRWVKFTYRYIIDDRTYTSNTIWPWQWQTTTDRSFGDRYFVGQEVRVYYDPENVNVSALLLFDEARRSKFWWAMILLLPIPIYVYGRMILRKLHGKPASWISEDGPPTPSLAR